MTVHKGVPNRSDRLRMSMDVRYQLVSEPFNIDNANPDGQPLSWEEVYADWRSDALKYYWQRLPLTLKPFDPVWFDRRDALGFALGEAGDPRARSVLQRIVARDAERGEAGPRAAAARRAAVIAFDVRHYDRIGSTNDEAQRLAAEGAPHGTVVHADEQTAGRGRLSRRWLSPPGNLYLSIVLRPDVPPARIVEIGFVAALAVADAVDALLPRQRPRHAEMAERRAGERRQDRRHPGRAGGTMR